MVNDSATLHRLINKKEQRKGNYLKNYEFPLTNQNSIFSVVTPEMHPKRRKSDLPTVISPSHSLDSIDNSLPGALTPPQNWIDEVKQNVRASWDMTSKDKALDTDWLSHCLESLLSQEIVEKYGFSTPQTATKVVLRDLIFTRKLKEVRNIP